jgi:hypothetical protein
MPPWPGSDDGRIRPQAWPDEIHPVSAGLRSPERVRLAVAQPNRITALVVQNGNAYDECLDYDFWKTIKAYWKEPTSVERRDAIRNLVTYEATKWQFIAGAKDSEMVSPDGAVHDQFLLGRKGNDEIHLDLLLSHGSNPPLYPSWQRISARPAAGHDRLGQE